jgi:hypothetical protein
LLQHIGEFKPSLGGFRIAVQTSVEKFVELLNGILAHKGEMKYRIL